MEENYVPIIISELREINLYHSSALFQHFNVNKYFSIHKQLDKNIIIVQYQDRPKSLELRSPLGIIFNLDHAIFSRNRDSIDRFQNRSQLHFIFSKPTSRDFVRL